MADHTLRARRLGIDTRQGAVVYMRRDWGVCRSEDFEAEARIAVRGRQRAIIATLNVVTGDATTGPPDFRAVGIGLAARSCPGRHGT